jgi:hypothetical protein
VITSDSNGGLSDEVLDQLAQFVALASAPGYLWENLSTNYAVTLLSISTAGGDLAQSLEHILDQEWHDWRE